MGINRLTQLCEILVSAYLAIITLELKHTDISRRISPTMHNHVRALGIMLTTRLTSLLISIRSASIILQVHSQPPVCKQLRYRLAKVAVKITDQSGLIDLKSNQLGIPLVKAVQRIFHASLQNFKLFSWVHCLATSTPNTSRILDRASANVPGTPIVFGSSGSFSYAARNSAISARNGSTSSTCVPSTICA